MRTVRSLLIALAFALAYIAVRAQSPAPIIVQAASPAATTSQIIATAPATSDSIQGAIKLLQEMKATNDETLKKQEATLQQLEELGQAAEELRIYAKRG
jgi:cell shape-determining protein MreC